MCPTYSAPQPANLKSSGRSSPSRGFSLVEVVLALGIVSFALMSILGVMSMTLVAHRDSSTDSIFSIMTETAIQEVHNYNSPATSLASGTYNFNNKLLPTPIGATPSGNEYCGYIYFDVDGQITADGSSMASAAGTPIVLSSSTQSTDVGANISTSKANTGYRSVPLPQPLALNALPTGTYYSCQITIVPATNSLGILPATTAGSAATPTSLGTPSEPSSYLIKLSFSWPPGKPVPAVPVNNFPRIILASISNTTD